MKRRKLNIEIEEPPKTAPAGYESAGEEGTIIGKRNLMNQTGLMSKKQKKTAEKVSAKFVPTPRKSDKKKTVE